MVHHSLNSFDQSSSYTSLVEFLREYTFRVVVGRMIANSLLWVEVVPFRLSYGSCKIPSRMSIGKADEGSCPGLFEVEPRIGMSKH